MFKFGSGSDVKVDPTLDSLFKNSVNFHIYIILPFQKISMINKKKKKKKKKKKLKGKKK